MQQELERSHQVFTLESIARLPSGPYRVVASYWEGTLGRSEMVVFHLTHIEGYLGCEEVNQVLKFFRRSLLPGDELWCDTEKFGSWHNQRIRLVQYCRYEMELRSECRWPGSEKSEDEKASLASWFTLERQLLSPRLQPYREGHPWDERNERGARSG